MPETTPLPRLKPEREADLRKRLADGTWPAKSVYELLAEIDALRAELAQVRARDLEVIEILNRIMNRPTNMDYEDIDDLVLIGDILVRHAARKRRSEA